MKKKSSPQVIVTHLTLGLQLAITIFIFVYIGYRLDLRYDKSPVFLSLGTIVGMAVGFYHMMKELQSDMKKDKHDESDEDQRKKIKWM